MVASILAPGNPGMRLTAPASAAGILAVCLSGQSFAELNMQKPTIIDLLTKAVASACAPVGIRKSDIVASSRGLSIPSVGIVMTLKLSEESDKKRVWHAVEHFSIQAFGDEDERKAVRVLFEVPLGSEWRAARLLAMGIAERKIDAAIDAATG